MIMFLNSKNSEPSTVRMMLKSSVPPEKKHIIIINKIPKEAEDINGMHDLLKFSSVYLRYMQMIFIIGNGNLYEQGILLREQQMITSQVLLTYFL